MWSASDTAGRDVDDLPLLARVGVELVQDGWRPTALGPVRRPAGSRELHTAAYESAGFDITESNVSPSWNPGAESGSYVLASTT
jgi:hypothetical protein